MGGMFPFPFSPSAPAAPQGGWVSQAFNANPNPFPNMVSGGPFYMDTGSALAGGLGGSGIPEALPSAMGFGSNVGASAGLAGMGGAGGGEALAGALAPAAEAAAGGAAAASPWLLPGIGARLGPAGPYALLGLGGSLLGSALQTPDRNSTQSEIGRFLQGAGTGAGIGAFAGNMIPIPGVGAGVGALVGGLAGGAYNLFSGGHHGASPTSQLDQANLAYHAALNQYAAVDPQTADIIHKQMSTMYGFATTPEEKIKLLQNSAATIAANMGISSQRTGAYSNATQLLNAVQNYQGQHADSSAAKYNADEAARAAYMNQLVGQMKPAQQAYGHYMVSQQLEQAAQALQSQQAQAQALPYMLALQMQNQIGQQYAPFGITPQMTAPTGASSSSGSGTGGIDLASILAQSQQPATTGP